MYTTSPSFTIAEAEQIQPPARLQVIARPDPEALQWVHAYTETGKAGDHTEHADSGYGWRGMDTPELPGTVGAACVTPLGTLLRTYGAGEFFDSQTRIRLNRASSGASDLQTELQGWATVRHADGVCHMMNQTREAISSDTDTRLFYIRATDQALVYVDLGPDGMLPILGGEAPEVVLDTTQPWTLTALASPHPHWVFACQRQSGGGDNGDPLVYWLELTAWQYLPSTDEWVKTTHPKIQVRTALLSVGHLLTAPFYFDAAFADEARGLVAVVLNDDLSGRPSSTLYHNRHWSDYISVEAIDLAEPERDQVIGNRLGRIGDLLILHSLRYQSDSDFAHYRQGVIFYSVDGVHWSLPYLVTQADGNDAGNMNAPFNWGKPVLWRDAIWLVGVDSLWRADTTELFGGVTASDLEVDLTSHVLTASVDLPEDRGTSVAQITLQNDFRMYTSHPIVRRGAEIEVRAGYDVEATELLPMFLGRLATPVPTRSIARDNTVDLSAFGYLDNFKQGIIHSIPDYPTPIHANITFSEEAETTEVTTTDGEWAWDFDDGAQFIRARRIDLNRALLSMGVYGDVSFQVRFRINNPSRTNTTVLTSDEIRFENVAVTSGGVTTWSRRLTAPQGVLDAYAVGNRITISGSASNNITANVVAVNRAEVNTDLDIIEGWIALDMPLTDEAAGASVTLTGILMHDVIDHPTYPTHTQIGLVWAMSPDRQQYYLLRAGVDPSSYLQDLTATTISLHESTSRISDSGKRLSMFVAGNRIQLSGTPTSDGEYNITEVAPDGAWIEVDQPLDHLDAGPSVRIRALQPWRLFKFRRGQPPIRLASGATISTPTTNEWLTIAVTQQQQRITVWAGTTVIMEATDPAPLNRAPDGLFGVQARLPAEAPAGDEAYVSIDVDEIRAWSHDSYTTGEELLGGIAVLRGLTGVAAPQLIIDDMNALDLDAWDGVGSEDAWTATANGLEFTDDFDQPNGTLWALLRPLVNERDGVVDLDMVMTDAAARFGIVARCADDASRYAALTINTISGTGAYPEVRLQVKSASGLTTHRHVSQAPVYNNQPTRFRFVVDGPWFVVYVNGLHATTFYSEAVLEEGRWGITPGSTPTAGTRTVTRIRMPLVSLIEPPVMETGDALDTHLQSMLKSQFLWATVDGRTLMLHDAWPIAVTATINDDVLMSAGYEETVDEPIGRMIVASTDPEGRTIVGTAYSPARWSGRLLDEYVEEDGLRDAAACRERAWALLMERDRQSRSRSYEVHPQLRWQQGDVFNVTNSLDDTTDQELILTGIARTWQREPKSGAVQVGMIAQLEELESIEERAPVHDPE